MAENLRRIPLSSAWTMLISMAVVLSGLPGRAGGDESPTIAASQFAIGGVTLGVEKVQDLIRAFGQPLEIRSEETEAGPDTAATYIFEGVEAYTQDGELLNLQCTSPSVATPDGVTVGDTVEKVFETYGVTSIRDRGDTSVIGYSVGRTDVVLLFFVKDGRVSKIELWFNYT